jgi:septum site-determining protein MinC
LDDWTRSCSNFFVRKPVVVDLTALKLSAHAIAYLIAELSERQIQIIGLSGIETSHLGAHLPPVLIASSVGLDTTPAQSDLSRPAPERGNATSLLVEHPVRSGQTVVFPSGDVVVLGPVASGAELIAGGSIHVYGALRGRAVAGSGGNRRARIFCTRNEAELLAIDERYYTTEDTDADLRGRAVQAWLEDGGLKIAALD